MWRILWRDHDLVIDETPVTVGRSASCRIVLDDTEVSRVHARFVVEDGELVVEDAQSTNGVFVNDQRIRGRKKLENGDRVVIGAEEMVATSAPRTHEAAQRAPVRRPTPPPIGAMAMPTAQPPAPKPEMAPTEKLDALQSLGRLADRMLAAGRADAAERVLQQHLHNVLAAVQKGEHVGEDVLQTATHHALRLADAKHDGVWAGFVLELHIALKRPVGQQVAKALASLIRDGAGAPREVLDRYTKILRTGVNQMRFGARPDEGPPTMPPGRSDGEPDGR